MIGHTNILSWFTLSVVSDPVLTFILFYFPVQSNILILSCELFVFPLYKIICLLHSLLVNPNYI